MKKLTILVVSVDGVGHVNACAGTAKSLLDRGHRVIFLLSEAFRGKLAESGFEEFVIPPNDSNVTNENAGENWAKAILEIGLLGPSTAEEKYRKTIETFGQGPVAFEQIKRMDEFTKKAMIAFKPDLFIVDAYLVPCIYYSGIPWVNNMSLTPLTFCHDESDNFPPAGSGLPVNSPRDETWRRFKELNLTAKYSKSRNDLFEHQMGYPRLPNDNVLPYDEALLTVYAFPSEYDYPDMVKLGWFNIEVFNKNVLREIVPLKQLVPESFLCDQLDGKWSGKWVYLSMGSMGSVDLDLMRRLLEALATTPHKYIVSKGPRHAEYSLPRNAWGNRYLPQTGIIPQMDLVITHGGNNTVTETFAQGKPMLVMPLFSDQFENAQRLYETGHGLRLDPYEFTESQLIEAVNRLLGDEELKVKLQKASNRILNENRHEQFAEKVEKLWLQRSKRD